MLSTSSLYWFPPLMASTNRFWWSYSGGEICTFWPWFPLYLSAWDLVSCNQTSPTKLSMCFFPFQTLCYFHCSLSASHWSLYLSPPILIALQPCEQGYGSPPMRSQTNFLSTISKERSSSNILISFIHNFLDFLLLVEELPERPTFLVGFWVFLRCQ